MDTTGSVIPMSAGIGQRDTVGYAPATKVRYWYMDTLRAYLMVGGVFYHAALVYAQNSQWRVRDPGSFLFDLIFHSLSLFRMPAFFLIAGFFCSFLFVRDEHAVVVRRRLVSLGLPFVSMVLSLQIFQYILGLVYRNDYPPVSWLGFVHDYFVSGGFISHLWFLLNLIVYYLVAGLFLSNSLFRENISKLLDIVLLQRVLRSKSLIAVCACGLILLVDRTIGSIGIGSSFDIDTVLRYLPFFLIGALVFLRADLFDAFLSVSVIDGAAFAVVAYGNYFLPLTGRVAVAAGELMFYLSGLLITVVLVRLSRRYMDRRSEVQQKLVDAAFSIYLFHHICVVGVSMAIMNYAPTLNVFVKYSVVVLIGCFVPYFFHATVIRRFPLVRLVFNGRTRTSSA